MFCPQCGAPIPDNARFCQKCGTQLQSDDRFCTVYSNAGSDNLLKTSKPAFAASKKLIIAIVGACLVLAAAIFAVVFIPTSSQGSNTTEAPTHDSAMLDFSDAKVGDIIQFGTYEQDNNTTDGKERIDWVVLDRQGGKLLVISEDVLDFKQYETGAYSSKSTWETCSLRKWLNEYFLELAFSLEEEAMIQTTDVTPSETDKVFVLSVEEVNTYFPSDFERSCDPSNYVVSIRKKWEVSHDGCSWWLRSAGSDQSRAAYVAPDGQVSNVGCSNNLYVGVRPALWLSVEP